MKPAGHGVAPTILGELGGGQLCGDEERLLGTALEDEAGGDVWAATVVLLAAGQAQVQGVVVERAVLIALRARAESTGCLLAPPRMGGRSWGIHGLTRAIIFLGLGLRPQVFLEECTSPGWLTCFFKRIRWGKWPPAAVP